jgi:hypothetical protein
VIGLPAQGLSVAAGKLPQGCPLTHGRIELALHLLADGSFLLLGRPRERLGEPVAFSSQRCHLGLELIERQAAAFQLGNGSGSALLLLAEGRGEAVPLGPKLAVLCLEPLDLARNRRQRPQLLGNATSLPFRLVHVLFLAVLSGILARA